MFHQKKSTTTKEEVMEEMKEKKLYETQWKKSGKMAEGSPHQ